MKNQRSLLPREIAKSKTEALTQQQSGARRRLEVQLSPAMSFPVHIKLKYYVDNISDDNNGHQNDRVRYYRGILQRL